MRLRWPSWPRRRRHEIEQALEDAQAQVQVSQDNLVDADQHLQEARDLAEWARKASVENRFDMRLRAAYRSAATRPTRQDPQR